jgi:hypothetical protein
MTTKPSSIRRWIQASLLGLGMLGLTQCVDSTAPRGGRAAFSVVPVWGPGAARTLAIVDEGGLPLDRVRVILVKPVNDTVKDTTVTVHRGDSTFNLPLTVNGTPGETLDLTLQFKSGETVLFEGHAQVTTVPLNRPDPPPATPAMVYIGPGKDAARVVVAPATGTFIASGTIAFTASVFDGADAALANTPIAWTSSDETLGAFTAPGVFTPTGTSGEVTVTAETPTHVTGTATITLIAPNVGPPFSIVSGDGQTGTVQQALAAPFVVKLTDQFGVPRSGVTVSWTRLSGTGTLSAASSTTDASGLASIQYTLGGTPGDETVSAAVSDVAQTLTFTAHAVAGAPSAVVLISGSAQSDTVGKTLANAFVVKVTDAAGNPLGGVTVTWTRTGGTGSAASGTSTTNTNGLASVKYTLGNTAGTETVTASVSGVASPATFTAQATNGKPAAIAIVSGNAQTDTILRTVDNPLVVKVTDAFGNAVGGATVTWTRTGGYGTPSAPSTTTNASGLTSITWQTGDISGTDTVKAAVAGVATAATFTVIVQSVDVSIPIVTGFAYLRLLPSPVTVRVGDTVTFTSDSISAAGDATGVTAQWASSHPGRGAIDANGRLIVADTGEVIVTATRNGLVGHARVTVLPAPRLTGFSFSPTTLSGILTNPLTTSFTFAAKDAGTGVISATLTLTSPLGTAVTCEFGAPSNGTTHDGTFDCPLTLPLGTLTGAWHVTSLVIHGSITRTYGESALALFSSTTLTINP